MKKILRNIGIFSVTFFAANTLIAQCTPDPLYKDSTFGIWPDTTQNLPCAVVNQPYSTVLDIKSAQDISEIDPQYAGVTINWIRLDDIDGLNATGLGLSWAAGPSGNNQWNSNNQGCVLVTGTPTTVGTYALKLKTTINNNSPIANLPYDFLGYKINVQNTCGTGCGKGFVNSKTVTLCGNDSMYLQNAWQTKSGKYYDTLKTSKGCDSVLITNLLINSVSVYDTIPVYDTTYVTKYDTIHVYDTTFVTVIDTVLVVDTQHVAVTDTLIIDIITGINPLSVSAIKVFPNPSFGQLVIENKNYSQTNTYTIEIKNSTGQQVFNSLLNQSQLVVDISQWASGLYFLKVNDGNSNTIETKKIILK